MTEIPTRLFCSTIMKKTTGTWSLHLAELEKIIYLKLIYLKEYYFFMTN